MTRKCKKCDHNMSDHTETRKKIDKIITRTWRGECGFGTCSCKEFEE